MNVPTKPDALAEFPIVITLPIQWGDQDAFGHVNNTIAADGDTVVVVFDYAANTPRRVPDDVCAAVEKLEGRSY